MSEGQQLRKLHINSYENLTLTQPQLRPCRNNAFRLAFCRQGLYNEHNSCMNGTRSLNMKFHLIDILGGA